ESASALTPASQSFLHSFLCCFACFFSVFFSAFAAFLVILRAALDSPRCSNALDTSPASPPNRAGSCSVGGESTVVLASFLFAIGCSSLLRGALTGRPSHCAVDGCVIAWYTTYRLRHGTARSRHRSIRQACYRGP